MSLLVALSLFALPLTGCDINKNESPGEVSAPEESVAESTDQAFLQDLEKGLYARWDLVEKTGGSKGDDATIRSYIEAELSFIAAYKDRAFENAKLGEAANNYIDLLGGQIDELKANEQSETKNYKRYNQLVDGRILMLEDFVAKYGLVISDDYLDSYNDATGHFTAADMPTAPATLPDDLYSDAFELDGVVYALPLLFSELEANGWEYEGEAPSELVAANYHPDGVTIVNGEHKASINFFNPTMKEVPIEECYIYLVSSTVSEAETGTELLLPGGIGIGTPYDDVIAKYGEPTDFFEGSAVKQAQYFQDSHVMLDIGFDPKTNTVEMISLKKKLR
jgi:hypothetical protein